MKAVLLLADGTTFVGESIGANGTTIGEAVFSTSMTGYQEMLTDPSFAGQILTLTYPLVGNYGTNTEDIESSKIQVEGFVVRELCDEPSSWRSTKSLSDYLKESGVVSIQGVDTRALTRKLRVSGVMMGAISTELTTKELKDKLEESPYYGDMNFVERVSTKEPYEWAGDDCSLLMDCPEPVCHVALVDLGVKRNIARCLVQEGCRVTVFPCDAKPEEIMAVSPDGLVFSPGPGDPKQLKATAQTMKVMLDKMPVLGICLGHQILGMCYGADTFKLKFGHRGANQPVKNNITGKVSITAQNHGYAVTPDGLSDEMQVSHYNLNDGTVEGLRHKELPIFSIQYHPEASAGPLDEGYLFKEFVENVMASKKG